MNLKKRYLKKKSNVRNSKRSGTSAEAVEKAEKEFRPYQFLTWLDPFIQLRESRSTVTKSVSVESQLSDNEKDEVYLDDFDPCVDSERIDEAMDEEGNPDSQVTPAEKTIKEVQNKKRKGTQSSNLEGRKKIKEQNKGTKDAYMDDMELSLFKSIKKDICESNQEIKKVDDGEDLFCKALAEDIKQLPSREKFMAKHEIRNVLFKYQMAALQTHHHHQPLNSTASFSQQDEESFTPPLTPNTFMSPPRRGLKDNCYISENNKTYQQL